MKAQLDDLPVGNTYFCAVTAYNTYGLESPYSNEISFTVKPPPEARDSDGDGLSDQFEESYSEDGDLDPFADLDGDLLPAFIEYAHGLDPLTPQQGPVSQSEMIQMNDDRYLCIRYRIDPMAENFVSINVERTHNLTDPNSWQAGQTEIVSSESAPEAPGLVDIVVRSLIPISEQPCEFLRLNYEIINTSP